MINVVKPNAGPDGHSSAAEQSGDSGSTQPPNAADRFRHLVDRANRGDTAALSEMRETLDQCPKLWQELGDLAAMARQVVIKSISSGDQLLAESIQRKTDELELELAGSDPSPLLRLGAQRFVAVWLQLQHADAAAAASKSSSQAKFWTQQQDRAGRRYERALKSLRQIIDADQRGKKPRSSGDNSNIQAERGDEDSRLLRLDGLRQPKTG